MYGVTGAPPKPLRKSGSKLGALLRQLSDDEDTPVTSPLADPSRPWIREFNMYLDAVDELPDGMSVVRWWGVSDFLFYVAIMNLKPLFEQLNAQRLPVWASLAGDYCAIMSSSVSSERAFSSAGITISKRRNRLKRDIVEPLQFLKCAIRTDLLYREPAPSSLSEEDELEVVDDDNDKEWEDLDGSEGFPKGWDELIIEVDNDDVGNDADNETGDDQDIK